MILQEDGRQSSDLDGPCRDLDPLQPVSPRLAEADVRTSSESDEVCRPSGGQVHQSFSHHRIIEGISGGVSAKGGYASGVYFYRP